MADAIHKRKRVDFLSWKFQILPEEMDEEQLLNELTGIMDLAADDMDLDAMNRVLDELDKISPIPGRLPSPEEMFSTFREKHKDLFEKMA